MNKCNNIFPRTLISSRNIKALLYRQTTPDWIFVMQSSSTLNGMQITVTLLKWSAAHRRHTIRRRLTRAMKRMCMECVATRKWCKSTIHQLRHLTISNTIRCCMRYYRWAAYILLYTQHTKCIPIFRFRGIMHYSFHKPDLWRLCSTTVVYMYY